MAGIQETKEVLVFANEFAIVILNAIKDGVQIEDVSAIIEKFLVEQKYKEMMDKAMENMAQVPVELSDINFFEGMALSQLQLSYIPKLIAALKK